MWLFSLALASQAGKVGWCHVMFVLLSFITRVYPVGVVPCEGSIQNSKYCAFNNKFIMTGGIQEQQFCNPSSWASMSCNQHTAVVLPRQELPCSLCCMYHMFGRLHPIPSLRWCDCFARLTSSVPRVILSDVLIRLHRDDTAVWRISAVYLSLSSWNFLFFCHTYSPSSTRLYGAWRRYTWIFPLQLSFVCFALFKRALSWRSVLSTMVW